MAVGYQTSQGVLSTTHFAQSGLKFVDYECILYYYCITISISITLVLLDIAQRWCGSVKNKMIAIYTV